MRIYITLLGVLLSTTALVAQYTSVESLVEEYSKRDGIAHTHVGKNMVWMAKAGAPKGAMDGVENIHILKFDDCTSRLYTTFRASADSLFTALGAECVAAEPTKKGSMEVYMERKESPTEYMTFVYSNKGDTTFMWMSGNLPSSLAADK